MLFGLLFFVPFLGLAVGAAAGAHRRLARRRRHRRRLHHAVREKVTPGTSALFLLSSGAVPDRINEAFTAHKPELLATNLSKDEESKLRETFEA